MAIINRGGAHGASKYFAHRTTSQKSRRHFDHHDTQLSNSTSRNDEATTVNISGARKVPVELVNRTPLRYPDVYSKLQQYDDSTDFFDRTPLRDLNSCSGPLAKQQRGKSVELVDETSLQTPQQYNKREIEKQYAGHTEHVNKTSLRYMDHYPKHQTGKQCGRSVQRNARRQLDHYDSQVSNRCQHKGKKNGSTGTVGRSSHVTTLHQTDNQNEDSTELVVRAAPHDLNDFSKPQSGKPNDGNVGPSPPRNPRQHSHYTREQCDDSTGVIGFNPLRVSVDVSRQKSEEPHGNYAEPVHQNSMRNPHQYSKRDSIQNFTIETDHQYNNDSTDSTDHIGFTLLGDKRNFLRYHTEEQYRSSLDHSDRTSMRNLHKYFKHQIERQADNSNDLAGRNLSCDADRWIGQHHGNCYDTFNNSGRRSTLEKPRQELGDYDSQASYRFQSRDKHGRTSYIGRATLRQSHEHLMRQTENHILRADHTSSQAALHGSVDFTKLQSIKQNGNNVDPSPLRNPRQHSKNDIIEQCDDSTGVSGLTSLYRSVDFSKHHNEEQHASSANVVDETPVCNANHYNQYQIDIQASNRCHSGDERGGSIDLVDQTPLRDPHDHSMPRAAKPYDDPTYIDRAIFKYETKKHDGFTPQRGPVDYSKRQTAEQDRSSTEIVGSTQLHSPPHYSERQIEKQRVGSTDVGRTAMRNTHQYFHRDSSNQTEHQNDDTSNFIGSNLLYDRVNFSRFHTKEQRSSSAELARYTQGQFEEQTNLTDNVDRSSLRNTHPNAKDQTEKQCDDSNDLVGRFLLRDRDRLVDPNGGNDQDASNNPIIRTAHRKSSHELDYDSQATYSFQRKGKHSGSNSLIGRTPIRNPVENSIHQYHTANQLDAPTDLAIQDSDNYSERRAENQNVGSASPRDSCEFSNRQNKEPHVSSADRVGMDSGNVAVHQPGERNGDSDSTDLHFRSHAGIQNGGSSTTQSPHKVTHLNSEHLGDLSDSDTEEGLGNLDEFGNDIPIGDDTCINDFTIHEYFEKIKNTTIFDDPETEETGRHLRSDLEKESPATVVGDLGFDELIEESPKCAKLNKRKANYLAKMRGEGYSRADGTAVSSRCIKPSCNCVKRKCYEKYDNHIRSQLLRNLLQLSNSGQNQFLSSHMALKTTARPTVFNSRRAHTRSYYLPASNGKVEVCKSMFMATFDIKDKKLRVLAKKQLKGLGIAADDLRSNNRNPGIISEEHRNYMLAHIQSFPAYTSHYSRERTSRKYLSSDLNVLKMYKLYASKCEKDGLKPVHLSSYRLLFRSTNLSFRKPKLDTCCTCDKLSTRLKTSKTDEEKTRIIHEREEHHARAQFVYASKRTDVEIAKKDANIRTVSFDLQKCLPTPYLNCGTAFYKRQLYTLDLTVFSTQKSGNAVTCYMWDESKARRGSQEISSCIFLDLHGMDHSVTLVNYPHRSKP